MDIGTLGTHSALQEMNKQRTDYDKPTSQDSSCNEEAPKDHLKKQPQRSFASFGFCAEQRTFIAVEDK
jgi:hypothetical protein